MIKMLLLAVGALAASGLGATSLAAPVAGGEAQDVARSASTAQPPTPAEVMALPEPLQRMFQERVIGRSHDPLRRLKLLARFLAEEDELGVRYKAEQTRTVAGTYRTREANCLSFTLLALALARQAGLDAKPQQINRIMAWGRTDGVVMQVRHANVVVTIGAKHYVLDIAANQVLGPTFGYRVEDSQLLASFYSNRAMELLATGQGSAAGAWMDVAFRLRPKDASLWNNAGVLSRRRGDLVTAEERFLHAAKLNPKLVSAPVNLVSLYHQRGDEVSAQRWQKRSRRLLDDAPYYQFSLGQRLEERGEYVKAERRYRRAIQRNQSEALFHFALARVLVHRGLRKQASHQLAMARDLSAGAERQRMQDKLDALQKLWRRDGVRAVGPAGMYASLTR